ncbi:MAG: glycosyltransferase [Rikenellaceae bacterium]|jgi:glycosyltransferase involved in cell wall biosynthesis|nr:glycosyltransferase [Rikenellaceae bacterium]
MNSQKSPLVSVLMPVYNGEAFVEKALAAVLGQTLRDMELVVVDDGSTDGSMEIVRRMAAQYPDRAVRIIAHERNRGAAAARNTALETAAGEYILFSDSDDWMEPGMCTTLLDAARTQDADVTMCDSWSEYPAGAKKVSSAFALRTGETYADLVLRWQIAPTLWNKLIRSDIIKQTRITFSEGNDIAEDFYFCAQLFYFAGKVARVPEALYHYRVDDSSLMGRARRDPAKMAQVITNMELTERFYASQPDAARYARSIMFSKLFAKKPLAITLRRDYDELWLATFRETDPYICRNHDEKPAYRLVEWLLSKRLIFLKNTVLQFLNLAKRMAGYR